MIEPRKYTQDEITSIIEVLRFKFPELTIDLYCADPRFIRIFQVIGEQRVDTVPIKVIHIEYIHIVEAEQIVCGFWQRKF